MILEEMVKMFLDTRRLGIREAGAKVKASPKTIAAYQHNLHLLIKWLNFEVGDPVTRWGSIRRTHIRQLIDKVDSKVGAGEWAEATKIDFWKSVRVFFRWVAKDPECTEQELPQKHQWLPAIGKMPNRIYVPPKKELKTFKNSFNTNTIVGYRDYVATCVMLSCGMRVGELCNIRVEDLLLDEGLLVTKGKDTGEHGRKSIPLNDDAVRLIRIWLRKRDQFKKTKRSQYLFISCKRDKMTPNAFGKSFRRHRGESRISPHTMRHTFCTMSLEDGMDLETLRNITGHSSYEMLRNYLHMAGRDKLKEAVNKHNILRKV